MNKEIYEKYEPVIGLEIHAQLLTESKAFSSSSTKFGASPNTNTDPVTLAHPGTLPVLNRKVVDYAIMMGLATNCKIRERNLKMSKGKCYCPELDKTWHSYSAAARELGINNELVRRVIRGKRKTTHGLTFKEVE